MTRNYVTFKLYPKEDHKKLKNAFYTVYIFHTHKAMYKFRNGDAIKDGCKKRLRNNYAAVCSSYNSKTKPWQFGILLFTKMSARKTGISAHEIAHACTYWFKYMEKKRNIFNNPHADEKYAYMIGEMMRQMNQMWWQLPKKWR